MTTNSNMPLSEAPEREPDIATRLAKKLEAKAKRDAAREEGVNARKLEALELEERFEGELGPIKKFFDIIETSEGPIVLKLGEAVLFKTWKGKVATKADPSLEDMHAFVFPCVAHPSAEKFLKTTHLFPGLLVICANVLTTLYQGGEHTTQGK